MKGEAAVKKVPGDEDGARNRSALVSLDCKVEALQALVSATEILDSILNDNPQKGQEADLDKVQELLSQRQSAIEEIEKLDQAIEHGPALSGTERSHAGSRLAEMARLVRHCRELDERIKKRLSRMKADTACKLDDMSSRKKVVRAYKAVAR